MFTYNNRNRFHSNALTQKDVNEYKKQNLIKNRVIAHIWTSENNIQLQGVSVGHVSLQVGETYMSLWPKQSRRKEFDNVPPEYVLNYEIEKSKYEGREPEYTFCFYTLNKQDIINKFKAFKNELESWCLYGGICKNAESCVSFAWKLLEAGGIENLVPEIKTRLAAIKESSKGSSFLSKASAVSNSEQVKIGSNYITEQLLSSIIISPDALVARLQLAHEAEIKKYPLIQEIKNPEEQVENTELLTSAFHRLAPLVN
jgi:hypothetical protein